MKIGRVKAVFYLKAQMQYCSLFCTFFAWFG